MARIEGFITEDNYGARNPDKTVVHVCTLCGFLYEASKMRRYKGKYYCYPQTCYLDIPGIRDRNKRSKG